MSRYSRDTKTKPDAGTMDDAELPSTPRADPQERAERSSSEGWGPAARNRNSVRHRGKTSIPISDIVAVKFSLSGDEDNKAVSVANITSYESFAGQIPVRGGVYDARLGTTDYSYRCWTCGLHKHKCLGHSGLLALTTPVEQAIMIADIRRWLKVTCFNCGLPVMEMAKFAQTAKSKRLRLMAAVPGQALKTCPHCDTLHPKVEKNPDDYFSFVAKDEDGNLTHLFPERIKDVFSRIPEFVVEFMGKTSAPPMKLIVSKMMVSPVTIRPSVRTMSNRGSSYHNMTTIVHNLTKMNMSMPAPGTVSDSDYLRASLNFRQLYFDMILGSSATSDAKTARKKRSIIPSFRGGTSSIMRRIPGKQDGRLRHSLTGKSTWSMGRSTISGNNSLRPYELGLPIDMARTLQVQETVQEYNKDWLMQFFINGKDQYPGCTRIRKRNTGAIYDIEVARNDNSTMTIEIGDVMWRDVVTGDICFFNRQPSLERSSIGGHRAVVLESDQKTLQINVTTCAFYGADFDGDQMSVIVPSSIVARAEASILSSITNWFISTKSSGPATGELQDSVIGMAELTRDYVVMNREHVMMSLQKCGINPPEIARAKKMFTGRETVSFLFETVPFDLKKKSSINNETFLPFVHITDNEKTVTVENGVMKNGILDDSCIGGAREGVFHIVAKRYGSKEAFDLVYSVQQLALQFLLIKGFTVSAGDIFLYDDQYKKIKQIVGELVKDSELITKQLIDQNLPPPIGMTVHQFYEESQKGTLQTPDDILKPVMENVFSDSNGLFKMIAHDSKGKKANLVKIMGNIGQMNVKQERPAENFAFRRTLPTFPRFTTDPAGYGFVASPYIVGMTSSELVFAAMNGRFDLITRALSTAVTGHFQRKAVTCLQSIVIDNFRRCYRSGKICAFLYGDTGFDTRRVEEVAFESVMLTDGEIDERYAPNFPRKVGGSGKDQPSERDLKKKVQKLLDSIKDSRTAFRDILIRMENSTFNRPATNRRYLPIDVKNIVQKIPERKLRSTEEFVSNVDWFQDHLNDLTYIYSNEIRRKSRMPNIPLHEVACFLFKLHILETIVPRLGNINRNDLEFIFKEIHYYSAEAMVDYGTAVGVLAAQSIGEPLTQYMLDSHHRSVAEGKTDSGIGRIDEIFKAYKVEKEKSPEMLIRVVESIENDKQKVQEVANMIRFVSFNQFVSRYTVLFERTPTYPSYKSDEVWMRQFEKNYKIKRPGDLTNWCLRFEISRTNLILNSVSLEKIVNRLRKFHAKNYIVHTPENSKSIVIRIYLSNSSITGKADIEGRVKGSLNRILKTIIQGVPGIVDAKAEKTLLHKIENGKFVQTDIYAIRTRGTNMYGILRNKLIDPYKSTSSSVGDTYSLLGVEAARGKIINETIRFMSNRAPAIAHVSLCADLMSQTGKPTQFERGGIVARGPTDLFTQMIMGDPIRGLIDATSAGMKVPTDNIPAKLILGDIPRIGSKFNRVYVDDDFVEENGISVDKLMDDLIGPPRGS